MTVVIGVVVLGMAALLLMVGGALWLEGVPEEELDDFIEDYERRAQWED